MLSIISCSLMHVQGTLISDADLYVFATSDVSIWTKSSATNQNAIKVFQFFNYTCKAMYIRNQWSIIKLLIELLFMKKIMNCQPRLQGKSAACKNFAKKNLFVLSSRLLELHTCKSTNATLKSICFIQIFLCKIVAWYQQPRYNVQLKENQFEHCAKRIQWLFLRPLRNFSVVAFFQKK